jgi:uncharacterized protein (DUF1330 family)
MPAYVIAQVRVTDSVRYSEYIKRAPDVVASFGGRYLARGGETVSIEGPEVTERVVILEFPNLEQAVACFKSQAYHEAREFRLGAAEMRLLAVDGYEGETG